MKPLRPPDGTAMTVPMPRLPLPALMLVTDRRLAGGEDALAHAVEAAVAGGVNVVQMREKDLPVAEMTSLGRRLRAAIGGRALMVVNGPLQVALACGADGVHLPEAAGEVARPDRPFLVGQSVHSRQAAVRAWEDCRDYLVAGPVYETPSHPGAPGVGPSLVREVTGAVAIPVLAIGGIVAARVAEVVGAGASGVAVISAILRSPSPERAAQELREVLETAWADARPVGP